MSDAIESPGQRDIAGFLVLDKEFGSTSMQAVAAVRRRAGGKPLKVGHAGTLDPLATGVLVIAIDRAATRLIDRIQALPKRYLTAIDLSAFTETDDREGARTDVAVERPPARDDVERMIQDRFIGSIMQAPPAYSAVKVAGVRAYRLARKATQRAAAPVGGLTVTSAVEERIAPRLIRIDSIEVVEYAWPLLSLDIWCGKGTYIRRLARDIGLALGTGGHCIELRRTAIGPFTETRARTLDQLPPSLGQGDLLSMAEVCAMTASPC